MHPSMVLRSYIRLVLESPSNTNAGTEPFQLSRPVGRVSPDDASVMHAIYREFPLVVTPWVKQAIGVSGGELDPDGTYYVEHEILIDYDADYQRGRSGNRMLPPDLDEFALKSWMPYAIDNALLSPEDATRLKAYIGDLTDEEKDEIAAGEAQNAVY